MIVSALVLPLLVSPVQSQAPSVVSEPHPIEAGGRASKHVILFQSGLSARPWNIEANNTYAHIDGLPFDGFLYNLPVSWHLFEGEYGFFDESAIESQFGGLDFSFEHVTHNYVPIYIRRRTQSPESGDFFDAAAWDTNVAQMRALARVARRPEFQCDGIFFDNEEYFERVWNYPDDVLYGATISLEEYRAKARERGRQLMEALVSEWPQARVIAAHGP